MISGERNREKFVNLWMEHIRAGKKFRTKYSGSKRWKRYRKMYRGDWVDSIIPVNRVFSFGRSLIPQVYHRDPRVSVTATKPELIAHARVVEAVDNHIIRETMLKGTLKTAILTAYLTGTGPIKLGFDSEFGYLPSQSVDADSATVTQHSTKEGRLIEYQTGVKPGMPWALPEQPEHVIVPFGYRHGDALPWIAHRILRPLDDIKQDQKYRFTKDLKGTRRIEFDSEDEGKRIFQPGDNIIFGELFEIRDMRTGQIHIICEKELLMSEPDALQIEGIPWEFIIFNEDPEFFFGIPDVSMIEPQQIELNEIRTQARRHRQITLLKFLYLKDAIDPKQLEALLSGEVGPAVGIDGESLAAAVSILQPHMPPDFAIERGVVSQDMRESMGFSENQLSAYKEGTPPTATETQAISGSHEARISERKDIVADTLTRIVRKWNQYIFSFWTGERVVQVVGPQGVQQWVKYTGEELRGEYNLRIDPDSGFPVNRQVKMSAAVNLLKMFGGDPTISQPLLKMQVLEQFESIFPGISQGLMQLDPVTAMRAGMARQPHPILGGGGGRSGGNQGGGREGLSPDNPMELGQFTKQEGM